MPTLAGQRAQFTYALNQYNLSEDAETRAKWARRMARYIAAAPANGFTVEEVTRGQIYPSSEVDQYLKDPGADDDPGITEEEALRTVEEAVDTSDVMRSGEGTGVVYAYGYRCCQDRLKVGFTEGNTVQLETRGRKIAGAGAEWFKAGRDEVQAIYEFIKQGGGG
jgi:hypothetical protein